MKTQNPHAPRAAFGSGWRVGVAKEAGSRAGAAFTLLELLVVIAIIGILAAIAVPTMNSFKPDVVAAATQQLLGDIGRARQLAMSERTTVYMVFVPSDYYNLPAYGNLAPQEQQRAERLLDKQRIGYNFVALRSLGDQPGRATPRYLSSWRTLPEGTFIPPYKFNPINSQPTRIQTPTDPLHSYIEVMGFPRTNTVPFPSEQAYYDNAGPPFVEVPYLAFNYLGQLITGRDELIPLARGAVSFGRDRTRQATKRAPTFQEQPPGNSTNSSYNVIVVDWLTGRAHVKRQEIQ